MNGQSSVVPRMPLHVRTTPMKKSLRRWALTLALATAGGLGGSLLPLPAPARAAAAGEPEVASIEKLKTDAFRALRTGRFDQTNQLLGQAAALSKDPQVQKMAGWT